MNICLYTGRALPKVGGAEIVVDRLASLFVQYGHDVTVLAPRPGWLKFPSDAVYPYRVIRHWPILSKRRSVEWYGRYLVQAHKKYHFDIIHSHEFYPQTYLAVANRAALGVPIVATSHGGDVLPTHGHYRHNATKEKAITGMRGIDAMIAVSPNIRTDYLSLCGIEKRVELISNGVDIELFRNPTVRPSNLDKDICEGEYIFFIGRFTKRKGVDVLLDAISRIPETGGVELVLAGYGREEQALRAKLLQLRLNKRVRFVGARTAKEKAYLMQNAMFCVVPTRSWEACSLVVLESFAAGKAVIGSRVPGITHLIEGNETGILVPPDDAEALGNAILELRKDSERRNRYGNVAMRFVEAFSWQEVARKHLELYATLS